ncbi:hypothetical protein PRZ48_006792 [Zasmidium cellare]|uniref:Xylanolytic transcriptional activator regulatory domain-containing protein n=1 Tax=Zasmidium cellare TaxID=395010 RepID=A0ABR0EHJ4_ZASCE|nr:hypothetical protein PRZ48_006792 [Zasmidium cellare]
MAGLSVHSELSAIHLDGSISFKHVNNSHHEFSHSDEEECEPARRETTTLDPRPPEILSVPSAGILMDSSGPPPKTRNDGFLGETSASAVVAELNSSMGINPPPELLPLSIARNTSIPEASLRSGAEVLAFFQHMSKIKEFVERWFEDFGNAYVMFRPMYRIWLDGLIPFVEDMLNDRLPDRVERRCHLIWRNTQQPLQHTGTTSCREWALQATGDNLRWETLGLILFIVSALAATLPGWDSVFKSGDPTWEKTTLMRTMLHLINSCVDLSKACGSRNVLSATLMYEKIIAISYVHGDTASEAWTSMGEACDTVVLMGLHLETKLDAHTPFFIYEWRLRQFNVVYSLDKFMATFMGRPPHISYRYSVIQSPTDLTDEEVCADWPDVQVALSQLDENGFAPASMGKRCRPAWRKAGCLRAKIREDVLELVIGPHVQDMEARIANIRAHEKEALAAMPPFAQLDPAELITNLKRDPTYPMVGRGIEWRPHDVLCFLGVHVAILHADFLMERAVVNRLRTDSSKLISAARRLFGLVLETWTIKDYLYEFQIDFTDMLAFYAVPPAGVLAMETLKRDQINDPNDDFPRSETLQQLCVLVPMLESVRPDEGNYSICNMGLNAIRKVLDRLLSKPRTHMVYDSGNEFLDHTQFGANIGNDADFLQWLGTVDFEAASWMDPAPAVGFADGVELGMQGAASV